MTPEQFNWVIALLLANIATVITVGWKLSRFFARMELKVDTMWTFFEKHNIGMGN